MTLPEVSDSSITDCPQAPSMSHALKQGFPKLRHEALAQERKDMFVLLSPQVCYFDSDGSLNTLEVRDGQRYLDTES